MTDQEPRQPRSYADLGVEMIRTLGKLGPVTIVVGGLLFAGYMYYQALTEAQFKADQQNQEKLEAAQKALIETYDSISALSQKQLSNVQQMLDLHDAVAAATEKQRSLQNEAETKAEAARAEAEAARAEVAKLKADAEALRNEAEAAQRQSEAALAQAERAKEEAMQLRKDAEALRTDTQKMALLRNQAERELAKLEEDRVKLQNEHDKVQDELRKRRETLSARAKQIEELKAQLEELATQVAGAAPVDGESGTDGSRLAQKILEQEASQQPRNLLMAAAQRPGQESFSALIGLDGLKESVLRPLLEEGLGFAGWIRLATRDETEITYFGILDTEDDAYISPLIISLDEGRVFDVLAGKRIFALRLPDVADWDSTEVIAYLESHDGDLESLELTFDASQTLWDLERILVKEFGQEDELVTTKVFGEIGELAFTPIGAFATRYPEAYADMRENKDFSTKLELGARMTERAQGFRPAALTGMYNLEPFADLQARFAALLTAAVKRDSSAKDYLMPYLEPGVVGRVAAAVLSDRFSIDATTATPPGTSFTQQSLAPLPEENSIWIIATSLAAHGEDALQRYTFRFARSPLEGGVWSLADFSVDSGSS